jgi:hypothetical protein
LDAHCRNRHWCHHCTEYAFIASSNWGKLKVPHHGPQIEYKLIGQVLRLV